MAYRTADATISSFRAVAVTPNDSTTLEITRALYIGVTGNLTVTMAEGGNCTFANVPVGIFPIQVSKVLSTGTAASSIVALY